MSVSVGNGGRVAIISELCTIYNVRCANCHKQVVPNQIEHGKKLSAAPYSQTPTAPIVQSR